MLLNIHRQEQTSNIKNSCFFNNGEFGVNPPITLLMRINAYYMYNETGDLPYKSNMLTLSDTAFKRTWEDTRVKLTTKKLRAHFCYIYIFGYIFSYIFGTFSGTFLVTFSAHFYIFETFFVIFSAHF